MKVSAVSSKAVTVSLTVPPDLDFIFDVFDNQSVGLAIREAIRSAMRPVRQHMKALMQAELMVSKQSTGASERALIIKYGRSRTNPRRFYGMVGIDEGAFELHSLNKPVDAETKTKKGSQRGAGLYAERGKKLKNGKVTTKQVFSRYRDTANARRHKNYIIKRRPSKYWHLINNGFNHIYGGRARAYNFVTRTKAATEGIAQNVFNIRLKELVVPVAIKEIDRRIKSASSKIIRGS